MIPEGWESQTFQGSGISVIDGDRGKEYPKSGDFFSTGYCLFLNAGNVTKNGFSFNDVQYISEEKDQKLRQGKLEKHDIVITTRGTIGNVAYYKDEIVPKKMRINSGMAILRTVDSKVFPSYLYQYLNSPIAAKLIGELSFGSAQPQITIKILNNLPILLPPLPEQRRIASILSSVDDAIQATQQVIDQNERVKRGLLQELLTRGIGHTEFKQTEIGEIPKGWEVRTLGDFIEDYCGGASLSPKDFTDVGIPILSKLGVTSGGLLRIPNDKQKYCSTEYANENKGSVVNKSYYIVVLRDLVPSGPSIGYVVKIPNDNDYLLAQGVYGLRITDSLIPEYLIQLSNSTWYRKQMQRMMVGSTQVHIRTPEYFSLRFPFPPKEEQYKIVSIMETHDRNITRAKTTLAQMKEIKTGLMQDLLSGKVRVKE